ncbi:Protein F59B8.1 a, partial [Aphelenchoides avenae]
QRLLEPYRRLKNALKKMQEDYMQSKEHNIFMRYSHMQQMIHEVTLLEKQYWQLIDIPMQDMSETPTAYVQRYAWKRRVEHALVYRVMNLLDEKKADQPVKVGGIASLLGATVNIAEKTKDQNLFETIRGKPTDELRKECDRLYIELYKLIRKYQGLRDVVHELTESFQDTRFYPIVPRYPILKTMIKRVLRAPAYAEICHEANE